jgi:hypothetical protein
MQPSGESAGLEQMRGEQVRIDVRLASTIQMIATITTT